MKLSHNVKKNEKKGPTRAVIYIRVSTVKQKNEGYGLESQLEKCMQEIKNKGMIYVDKYVDGAISGTKVVESRDGLKRLCDDVEKNIFDAVVVYKVDRLGRSMKIIIEIIDFFTSKNIKLVSCMEDVDTTKSSGLMTVQLFAVIAQYEKNTIGERLMLGRETVFQNRGETGGSIPYGYKRLTEGKKITISSEEGKILRAIFRASDEGYSMSAIALELNAKGVSKKRGKKWYASTISTILENRDKYEGGVRNNNVNGVRWPVLLYNKVLFDNCDRIESEFLPEIKLAIFSKNCLEIPNLFGDKKIAISKRYEGDLTSLLEDFKTVNERKTFNYVVVNTLDDFHKDLDVLSDIFINFLDSEIKIILLNDRKDDFDLF